MTLSRRRFISSVSKALLSVAAVLSCGCTRRRYKRPPKLHRLGHIKDMLYTQKHVMDKSMLVYRDAKGWSALSTRCTYDGCELTFQEKTLFVPAVARTLATWGSRFMERQVFHYLGTEF